MNRKIIIKTYKNLLKTGNRLDMLHDACIDEHKRYVNEMVLDTYHEDAISNSLSILLTLCSIGIDARLPYDYMMVRKINLNLHKEQTPSKLLLSLDFVYRSETNQGSYIALHKNGIDYINNLLSTIV